MPLAYRWRITGRIPALLLPAILLGGCVSIDLGPSDRYRTSFHYTWDLQPGSRLNLESFNGPVEIIGWDQNKIEVSGEKYASTEEGLASIKLDSRNDPHSVEIRARKPSASFGARLGVSYTIHAPWSTVLERIITSNGALHVRDIGGEAQLRTSNGAIRLEHLTGGVDAGTSNGPIEASDLGSSAKLKTSNGPIRVEDVEGDCDAHTSNGSVNISMKKAPKSGIRVETSNGSVTLRLPGETSARVEANTSNASVSSDFNVTGDSHDSREQRHHMSGTIGAGGPLIDITTHNGRISLLRR